MTTKPCAYSSLDGINLASGKKIVAVHLLTSEIIYFTVEKNCKVNELFTLLCRQLNLVECIELFGLCMRQDQCRWYSGFGLLSSPLASISGGLSSNRSYNASQVEAAVQAGEAELAAQNIFLDPCAKLSKYACKQWKHAKAGLDPLGRPYLQVQLRVQFYVDSYLFLVDRVARYHYYLQLRRNLLDYTLSALTVERAFLLASIALQADKGDQSKQRNANHLPHNDHLDSSYQHLTDNLHGHSSSAAILTTDPATHSYFQPSDYLPGWLLAEMGDEYVLRHLPTMHADQSGLSSAEAQLLFIKEASEQAEHNVHMYRLFCHSNHQSHSCHTSDRIWLAICSTGVHLYEQDRSAPNGFFMRSKLSTFAWPDIGKLFFEKRKFEIRSIGHPVRKFTYFTCSEEMAKHLLWLCRVSHQFQLMIAPRLREMKRRENELSRKRYRESYIYSGEDQHRPVGGDMRSARRTLSSSSAARSGSMSSSASQPLALSVSMINAKLSSPTGNTGGKGQTTCSPVIVTKPEIHAPPFPVDNGNGNNLSTLSNRQNDRQATDSYGNMDANNQLKPYSPTASVNANATRSSLESLTTSGGLSSVNPYESATRRSQSSVRSTSNGSYSSDSAFVSCDTTLRDKLNNIRSKPLSQLRSQSFGKLLIDSVEAANINLQSIANVSPSHNNTNQHKYQTDQQNSPVSTTLSCQTLSALNLSPKVKDQDDLISLKTSGSAAELAHNKYNNQSNKQYQLPTFASLSNFNASKPMVGGQNQLIQKRFGRLASTSKSMPNVAGELFNQNMEMDHQAGSGLHRTQGALTLYQTSPQVGSVQSVFSANGINSNVSNRSSPNYHQMPMNASNALNSKHVMATKNKSTNSSTSSSRSASDSDTSQGRVDMATSPMRQHIYENVPFHRPPLAQNLTPVRVGPKIGVSSLTRGMHLAAHSTYQNIGGASNTFKLNQTKGSHSIGLANSNVSNQTTNQTSKQMMNVFHSEPNIPNFNGTEISYKATRALSDPTTLGIRSVNNAVPTSNLNTSGHVSTNQSPLKAINKLPNSNANVNDRSPKRMLPKRSPSTAADLRMNRTVYTNDPVPMPALAWAKSALHQSLCDLGKPLQGHLSVCNLSQIPKNTLNKVNVGINKSESSSSLLNPQANLDKFGRLQSRYAPNFIGGSTQAIYQQLHSPTGNSSKYPLRHAESEMQLNGSMNSTSGLQLIPPPPDYASYMNKQQRQQLIASGANHLLMNGRLKATSEQQLNHHSNALSHFKTDCNGKPQLDLASLRQRSHDLDLPLITALFNDRSLMLPKTIPNRNRSNQIKHSPNNISELQSTSGSNVTACLPPHPPKYNYTPPLSSPSLSTMSAIPVSSNVSSNYTITSGSTCVNNHLQQSLMEMSCVDVTPVDLPPAQVQVLPLTDPIVYKQQQNTFTSAGNAYAPEPHHPASYSLSHTEQMDRNHNTLNCNYNLPSKSTQTHNPTAEFIEKLWAEHFSQ